MKHITVWMPEDEFSTNNGVREDLIKAVKAAGGHIKHDEGWNYVAVCNERFTGGEASDAMEQQSGDTAIPPGDWIEEEP